MNPTPETDAEAMHDYVLADFARKLEQDRDKARSLFQSSERARASLDEALDKVLANNTAMRKAIMQANERLLGLEDHLTKIPRVISSRRPRQTPTFP